MANFNATNYTDLSSAITTANGTTVNDTIFVQNDIVLTADQALPVPGAETSGNLRLRSQQGPTGSAPVNYKIVVDNALVIGDSTPATEAPSVTFGPLTIQIGTGGTTGSISGNFRLDDDGVLAINRSVDTIVTSTITLEDEDTLRNDVAGTTATFTASTVIRVNGNDTYDLELDGPGDGLVVGAITAGGAITKEGDGTWTFAGANTYTGLTTVSEGTLTVRSGTALGATTAGTIVEDGASLAIEHVGEGTGLTLAAEALTLSGAGAADDADPAAVSGALVNVEGDNTVTGAITLAASARIQSEDDTLTLTGGIDGAAGAVLTLGGAGDGVIDTATVGGTGIGAGVGGLIKDGTGTWTLRDANTVTGPTTVSGGTLLVDGSLAGSAVTVTSGGTLGGTGTLGTVTVEGGGTFAAGDEGVGSIASGGLTLNAGAIFAQEIGGTAAGASDLTSVTGTVVLGGAALDLSLVGDFVSARGDSVTLIANDGADAVQGTFDGLAEGGTVILGGRALTISYAGGDGNDVVLTDSTTFGLIGRSATTVYDAASATDLPVSVYLDPDTAYDVSVATVGAGQRLTIGNGTARQVIDLGTDPSSVNLDFSTNRAAVSLSGGTGGDILRGGAGDDTLAGRAGDDRYVVENAGDRVFEIVGAGTDTVLTNTSYRLQGGQEIENLQLLRGTGTAALDLTGNEFAQTLRGNGGANILDGQGGADALYGYGGNDKYVVDTAGDLVFETAGGGNDTVLAGTSYALQAGQQIENLQLLLATRKAALDLTGNEFAQTLRGNDGANILDGKGGADALYGYGGNDKYVVDTAGDLVFEAAGGGNDTVLASTSYALQAGQSVENLQLLLATRNAALNLTGNELGQTIRGNDGANILDGKGGGDVLFGKGGADTFVFSTALGAGNVDRIGDFSHAADTIGLARSVFTALAPGQLQASAFKDLSVATVDADDRVIYDRASGTLSYDADGSGTKSQAVAFAVIDTKVQLDHTDFLIG